MSENKTDDKQETSLQRVLTTLAANRCYACGWPLGVCQPFNCAMRYRDDTQHLAEREGWLERQREMSAVLTQALSATTETLWRHAPVACHNLGIDFIQLRSECEKLAKP